MRMCIARAKAQPHGKDELDPAAYCTCMFKNVRIYVPPSEYSRAPIYYKRDPIPADMFPVTLKVAEYCRAQANSY